MNNLRFHVIQHASFEKPGHILNWIEKNGHQVSFTKIYNDDSLPEHRSYDVLVVMGGPMSVNDECLYPWLSYEKRFIREAINMGRKVIGICLGSQLVANVLGAKVYPNTQKEIGYFPIQKNTSTHFWSTLPEEMIVFHWHGDTFELPENAVLLASSDATRNQAFLYESNVLAIQFHLEVTQTLMEEFLKDADSELISSPFVQTKDEILKGSVFIPTCNMLLEDILESFVNNQS